MKFADAAVFLDQIELWEGKEVTEPDSRRRRILCRGLLEDWVSWQGTQSPEFDALKRVLCALSEPDDPLIPGPPMRLRLDDRRDIPSLSAPYGEVPVTLASAGVRRVLGLAYVLVWAWTEHVKAAGIIRRQPTRDMVVLIDEIELHLHPSWQRLLLPAVMKAVDTVAPDVGLQLIATSHAPLVLASVESLFNEEVDNLFHFHRVGRDVVVEELSFTKQGDASNWLDSEVFGETAPRSIESDLAIEAAMAFMREDIEEAERYLREWESRIGQLPQEPAEPPDIEESYRRLPLVERVHHALKATLPGQDDFWPQWVLTYKKTT